MFWPTIRSCAPTVVFPFASPNVTVNNFASCCAKGSSPVRSVLRALTLLQLDAGQAASEVAADVHLTSKAVREIGRRYEQGGLERVLYDKQRPGAASLLEASQKQRIIAMVCSNPPPGRARWTVRLIAEEAGPAQARAAGGARNRSGPSSKPQLEAVAGKQCGAWRSWMREYIERMEDVLALYEKPYDPAEPGRFAWTRNRSRCMRKCGRPGRQHPATLANRIMSINAVARPMFFALVEPKAGRHFTCATPNRSAAEFAKVLASLLHRYPSARTIHLVWDNLNIHC